MITRTKQNGLVCFALAVSGPRGRRVTVPVFKRKKPGGHSVATWGVG